ncbi:MAG TPA: hypothetical protein VHE54_04555 [Puia sp.]|nr:hypothetical protein [Puia sp.]
MPTLIRSQRNLAVIFLLSLIILSCQKEVPPGAENNAGSSNKETAKVVQGPPTLVWWANAPAIPYSSELPNDVLESNNWPIGFAINGKGFVCGTQLWGDYSIVGIRDLWEYDAPTASWIKKAPFPGNPSDLIEAANFVIGDNAYIVTGNAAWKYNEPADSWAGVAFVPALTRRLATAFPINGKGYMGLGFVEDNGIHCVNDWWEYDPVANRWTQKSNFPGGKRAGAEGFAIDGMGYVVSGETDLNILNNKVWQYDPVADTWTRKADFPGTGRWNAVTGTATIGGHDFGLIIGGNGHVNGDDQAFDDSWEYNPITDTWGQVWGFAGGNLNRQAGFVLRYSAFVINTTVQTFNWSN